MFEKLKSRWGKDRREKKNAQKRLEHMKILFPVFNKFGSLSKKSKEEA